MAIIVFGANGFIGRNIIHDLSKTDHEVIALSRSLDSDFFDQYPNIQCHKINFQNTLSYQQFIKSGDTVIHLIYQGVPYMADENRVKDIDLNLIPTIKLLELCLELNIKRFIYASSGGAIYGNTDQEIIDEDTPARPINSYGITRLASENYIQSIFHKSATDFIILRISNPYGRFAKPDAAIGLFNKIEQCLIKDEVFELRAPLDTTRDYIEVREVSANILRLIQAPAAINEIFNISSGVGMTIENVILTMEKKYGKKLRLVALSSKTPIIDSNILDNRKLKSFYQKSLL